LVEPGLEPKQPAFVQLLYKRGRESVSVKGTDVDGHGDPRSVRIVATPDGALVALGEQDTSGKPMVKDFHVNKRIWNEMMVVLEVFRPSRGVKRF